MVSRRRGLRAWLVVKETADDTWYLAMPLLSAGAVWTGDRSLATVYFDRRFASAARTFHSKAGTRAARVVPVVVTPA